MDVQKLLFTLFILLIIGSEVVAQSSSSHPHGHKHRRHRVTKSLFVFGDSYADTGNQEKSNNGAQWNEPYGITFPGKPTGRFSDGRVFTDFLATSLGLKSPLPYRWRSSISMRPKHGMNFAFGGTGVFDTLAPYPNMTTQIDFFQQLLKESVFTPSDLRYSVAHVSLSGNDYSYYLARGGSFQGLETFISQVVNQLVTDLGRIYNLGVKKISVTGLQPLGCLPADTFRTSYQSCNSTNNQAVIAHNLLLQQAVAKLNQQHRRHHRCPSFVIIDLYSAFSTIIREKGAQQGKIRFENPLKPCCIGLNETYNCGDVDTKGNKMYTVCQDPKSYFIWDLVHPTQAGWTAITSSLQSTFQELLF